MATLNWCYGIRDITLNADLVMDQMRKGHRYRNKLCELELQRRKDVWELLHRIAPETAEAFQQVAEKEAAVEAIYTELKKARAKVRRRIPLTDETRERIKAAKTAQAAAYKNLKAVKTAAFERPDVKAALEPLNQQFKAAQRDARKDASTGGLYWGSYLTAEAAAASFGEGPPPRFKRADGCGVVAVQLQNGLTVADALACEDERLQLQFTNEEELCVRGKSGGLKALGRVKLRIGSDAKRKPIWAEFTVFFHRALPEDARIQWAYVHRTMAATTPQWQLRLCIVLPQQARAPKTQHRVAVHPGYRMLANGDMRVAVWEATDGQRGEITLPAKWIERDKRPDELQGHRDDQLNQILPEIHERLIGCPNMPEWLAEASKTLIRWESQARLAALALQLRSHLYEPTDPSPEGKARWKLTEDPAKRFDGDVELCERLDEWRKTDKHFYEWAVQQRRGDRQHRNRLYRTVASQLASQYEVLVIHDASWKELFKIPAMEKNSTVTTTQRRYGKCAAPGTLLTYMKEAFRSDMIKVTAKKITMTCHSCHAVNTWDQRELSHTCEKCGLSWDQDRNAALNQLQWAADKPRPETPEEAPRSSRFARKKQAREAKAASNGS